MTSNPIARSISRISEAALARLRGEIPLGRLACPEDIWLGVRFLIESDFFTGRNCCFRNSHNRACCGAFFASVSCSMPAVVPLGIR